MPDRFPITVTLHRDGEEPQPIDVSAYNPPLQGILWNTADLRGLTGLYLLVPGGVTAATLEYEAQDVKHFGAEPGFAGVLWTKQGLGNNSLIAVNQHTGPYEYVEVFGAEASEAQG